MSTASRALFGLACALFACGVLSAATGTQISDDPRQQIAQWSNESGQLRGYPASGNDGLNRIQQKRSVLQQIRRGTDDGEGDEDDLVYDDVSFAQDSAAAESDELSGNPEFPSALVFNSESESDGFAFFLRNAKHIQHIFTMKIVFHGLNFHFPKLI